MKFPIAKLLDYEAKWHELEQSSNPFAVVVMAHLKAIATHGRVRDRLQWKKTLIRRMYEKGHSEQEVLDLFRFIDWIMKLPEEFEKEIQEVVDEFEEAKQMRYVTSIERLAQKRGREQGLEQGLEQGTKVGRQQAQREMILHILRFRFQPDPETTDSLLASLKLIEEEALLQRLIDRSLEATALSEFVANLKEEEAKLAQKDE